MLNKAEEKFIKRIKQKLSNCEVEDCGKNFTFEILQYELENMETSKHSYQGICNKCHISLKLKGKAFGDFSMFFGKPEVVVIKTTPLEELFDFKDGK